MEKPTATVFTQLPSKRNIAPDMVVCGWCLTELWLPEPRLGTRGKNELITFKQLHVDFLEKT
jgi:hypothetical protein